jgi:hypothetical protein
MFTLKIIAYLEIPEWWKNVFGILRTDILYACFNSPYKIVARIL